MTNEEAKKVLSNIYELQLQDKQMSCPCCGGAMRPNSIENSLSRYHEVFICSDCGVNEAFNGPKPLEEWAVVKGIATAHEAIEKAIEKCEDKA